MADAINIQLLDIYQVPTDADIRTGKNYVLRREAAANALASLVDELLEEAAEKITALCYKYNVDPNTFTISYTYNQKLFEEISEILDRLEDEILDLMLEYSMMCTESEKRRHIILPWILALGAGGKTLKAILDNRLWMFSRDLEAMIVAARLAKFNETKAISLIRSFLHTAYAMPGMANAFKKSQSVQATYVRSKGVKPGNVGSSNSEANNIERLAKTTVQKSWMRNQWEGYREEGADGFMVFRGSNFDCPLCDSYCNVFHPIDDWASYPPFHPSCACWTLPIYAKY